MKKDGILQLKKTKKEAKKVIKKMLYSELERYSWNPKPKDVASGKNPKELPKYKNPDWSIQTGEYRKEVLGDHGLW